MGTNHLGHFLLANLMVEDLKTSCPTGKPRMIIVGVSRLTGSVM